MKAIITLQHEIQFEGNDCLSVCRYYQEDWHNVYCMLFDSPISKNKRTEACINSVKFQIQPKISHNKNKNKLIR